MKETLLSLSRLSVRYIRPSSSRRCRGNVSEKMRIRRMNVKGRWSVERWNKSANGSNSVSSNGSRSLNGNVKESVNSRRKKSNS